MNVTAIVVRTEHINFITITSSIVQTKTSDSLPGTENRNNKLAPASHQLANSQC